MVKKILASLSSALVLAVVANAGYWVVASVQIHNNYDSPISYAVGADPVTASRNLKQVQQWMNKHNLDSGNSCLLPWEAQQLCNMTEFSETRLKWAIAQLDAVKDSKDFLTVSNVQMSLRRQLMTGKDQNTVVKTDNLSLFYRYGANFAWVGLILDWLTVIAAIILILALPSSSND